MAIDLGGGARAGQRFWRENIIGTLAKQIALKFCTPVEDCLGMAPVFFGEAATSRLGLGLDQSDDENEKFLEATPLQMTTIFGLGLVLTKVHYCANNERPRTLGLGGRGRTSLRQFELFLNFLLGLDPLPSHLILCASTG